jgi:hypothetical protein
VLPRIAHRRSISVKYGKELSLTINEKSAKIFKGLLKKVKSREKGTV